ncbi:type IV secretory system conjugative DNA transfer family protein [Herbaspirillum sp. CAH-3]|uniref:type IV secretory system conjugative DNA transfer family protein n=1 Tax=Herbaspirillum sp. CAH-3 TaxID=2605746 RepID=UPI0018A0B36F|nr:type IV secretory system conjugative DNA transfer family protein [Herbaspirillum sp. CAH-3]
MLDKIKSALLASFCGSLAAICTSCAAGHLLASRYQVTLTVILRYVFSAPANTWPHDVRGAATLVVAIFMACTFLLWLSLKDMRWGSSAGDLTGSYAISNLLSKSTIPAEPSIFAGTFSGKRLQVGIEDRGLVIGPPGTGKTAFLLNQVLQASASRLSFVLVDIKPELHTIIGASLKAKGYRVFRINPATVDADADHWNPLDEVNDETELAELCSALLPIRSPEEAPFIEAQRDWLEAAMFHVKSTPGGSLPSAFNLLSSESDPLKILSVLGRSQSPVSAQIARRMAAGLSGSKPDPLILQGLTGCMRSLKFLSLPGVQDSLGHSDFSIRDLGHSQVPSALFLQFEESKIAALGPLLAFAATASLTTLIRTANDRAPVALFLDELGNMPPLPNLAEKLNTIRSRHMPTWMYFQSAQQIEKRYGTGATDIFFASADVQMVFRLNDQATRALVSQLIGTTLKKKTTVSTDASGGRSHSQTRERVNVIEPHELGRLKPGQILLLYRGAAALGWATPYFVDYPKFRK